MRHAKFPLLCVLGLCLVSPIAGCGSTTSGSGSTTSGTFTLGANAAVTVTQGQTSTITVTPTSANSFTGSVQVSVSGLPTGVTVSPATATLTMGSSTTFTLIAAADAALGTTTVKVYGASGILSTSTSVALTVVATTPISTGDFTLTASPSTLALTQGTSGQVTLSGTAIDGFSGTIAVAVNGLPTGVTASPATISVTPNTPVVVTLTAASDAPVTGPVTVHFVGTSGILGSSTSVALTVVATTPISTADFTLAAAPSILPLTQGTNGQVTLSSTAIGGFSGTIAVAVNGLPTGVTASPTTISVTPNTPFVVTLTATSNAPVTGPVTVSFVGTSGTLSHTATIQLSVVATGPDFAMTVTPNTLTLPQGSQSDPLQVGVTATGGFTGTVTFTVSGLPTDVTMIPPSGASLTPGEMDPIVFVATADAPLGTTNVTITGTSGGLTRKTTLKLTVSAPPPPDAITITVSPASQTVTVGSIAAGSVTATTPPEYTDPITVTVSSQLPTGVMVSPATASLTPGVPQTFVLIAGQNATPGTSNVTFLGQDNSVNGSANLSLTVVASPTALLDVPTWHYDTARTGLYSSEPSLTPTSVTAATFGKTATYTTDGAVDAQPLFLSGLTINGQGSDVLYTATENDTVYAWDVNSGSLLWKKSAIGSGETASDNQQGCNELPSTVGITSTPVIDRYFGTDGAIYFVAKHKDGSGTYHQRLHALDLTTGAELTGIPVEITATSPGSGGWNTFDPSIMVERAALLLSNGTVYLSWAAPCHQTTSFDYESWVMAYNEATLAQQSVLDLTPNGSGGGIWMSGAGPAADADGNVFLITSEGTFDTTLVAGSNTNLYPANGDYGNGYVKIQPTNGVMSVFDYFEPLNGVQEPATDQGSGGVLLMPDIPLGNGNFLSLAVGAGKDGNIYVMGRSGSFMGEYNGSTDNIIATLKDALANGASSSPAYFNETLYYGGIQDSVKAIPLASGSTSESGNTLGPAGAAPVISASATSTPVAWVLDTTASDGPVLYAYDATDLTTLYNSPTQTSGAVDATSKYSVPVVANGHVYIGTQTGVNVFGLLP